MAAFIVATFTLAGCASSNDNMNTTAMDDTVSMSETQTMAGSTSDANNGKEVEVGMVASVPVAVMPIASLSMENTVPVGEMFEDVDNTEQYDVLALAQKSPNLSTFVKLIELADLQNDLQRVGDVTIFAPTNEAFAKLPQDQLKMLLDPANKAQLMQVLQAHVLPNKVASTEFNTMQRITLSDDRYIPVDVSMNGTVVTIGGATIVKPNIEASNGIIHVVDNVILPQQVAQEDSGL